MRSVGQVLVALFLAGSAWSAEQPVFDRQGREIAVTLGNGAVLRYGYRPNGRLVWDAKGNLIAFEATNGDVASYAYDRGYLNETRIKTASGAVQYAKAAETTADPLTGLRFSRGVWREPSGAMVGIGPIMKKVLATASTPAASSSSFHQPFAFTGHIFDRETGLYFMKARYYDPAIGRFIQQDSFLGRIDDVPSLHRYAYGHNNPTGFIDPTGHESYRQWIGLDRPTANVGLEFAKEFGYAGWNFISFGALNRQDTLVERSEAGLITENQYRVGTAINTVGTGMAAAATFASAGAAGHITRAALSGAVAPGTAAVSSGASGGAAAGLVSSTLGADVDMATGVRRPIDVHPNEFVAPTVVGGLVGGVFGAASNPTVRPAQVPRTGVPKTLGPGELPIDEATASGRPFTVTENGAVPLEQTPPRPLDWRSVVSKKGETRVDHVRRHNVDAPQRAEHGVFFDDGVKVTDEAWARAQELGLVPDKTGELVVPMGRQVGWMGGKAGSEAAIPLNSVRIYVMPGTNKLISAYPGAQ